MIRGEQGGKLKKYAFMPLKMHNDGTMWFIK